MKNEVFDSTIETPRLLLRRLRPSDDEDMFEFTSQPEVVKYLSWHAHQIISTTQNYINTILNEYESSENSFTWGLEHKIEKKLIGVVRVFDISLSNKRVELSYILNPNFQNMGLMHEALSNVIAFLTKKVGINRVQARCTANNKASMIVMKKLGMSYEGCLKEYWVKKGKFEDALLFAFIKEKP